MLQGYIALLIVISAVTFFVYVTDKRKAVKGKWRTPESLLLGLSFFCGAFGGYLAMWIARHKTRKFVFHLVNLLGLAWQIALLVYLVKNPTPFGGALC